MEPGGMKMFMQYLSGAGAALSGQPWAQSLNQMTQQNLAAQSQTELTELYRQILAGKIPGAKANLSEKGMNLTMPSQAMLGGGARTEGHMGAVSDLGAGVSGVPTPTTVAPGAAPDAQQRGGFLSKLLNPSVSQPGSGAIPPSALVGLSPQDVSAALSGALNIEQLRQKQIMDMMGLAKGDPLETEFPIPHPEAGLITQRQWSSLPTEEREFSAYVHAAKKLGAPKEELTRKFFSALEPTEREQFMRAAMEDPALMEATKGLAKSGATRITLGEKLEEKKAFGKLKGQLYFSDPDWIGDLSKHMSSKGVRSSVLFADDPGLAKGKEKYDWIIDKITAGKGNLVKAPEWSEDGKTVIFTVMWPSGDMETIKHAIME